jgi:peptidoglycan/LPS O-acetylase OafA/YrhL
MSHTNDTNELSRPVPPSRDTPTWQVAVVAICGAILPLLVILAMYQDYRAAIEMGTILVGLGFFMAIGLIATSPLISRLAALCLFAGGIAILWLGFTRENPLWMGGGLFVFLAGEVVLLRDRFISRV